MNKVVAIEWLYDLKHYIKYDEQADALDVAIASIHRSTPQKPVNVYKTWDYGNISKWVCPSCSYEHRSSSSRSCAYDYCTECGQAIDWEV